MATGASLFLFDEVIRTMGAGLFEEDGAAGFLGCDFVGADFLPFTGVPVALSSPFDDDFATGEPFRSTCLAGIEESEGARLVLDGDGPATVKLSRDGASVAAAPCDEEARASEVARVLGLTSPAWSEMRSLLVGGESEGGLDSDSGIPATGGVATGLAERGRLFAVTKTT